MKSPILLCLVFACVFARIPFLEKVFTPQEVKEGNNSAVERSR